MFLDVCILTIYLVVIPVKHNCWACSCFSEGNFRPWHCQYLHCQIMFTVVNIWNISVFVLAQNLCESQLNIRFIKYNGLVIIQKSEMYLVCIKILMSLIKACHSCLEKTCKLNELGGMKSYVGCLTCIHTIFTTDCSYFMYINKLSWQCKRKNVSFINGLVHKYCNC